MVFLLCLEIGNAQKRTYVMEGTINGITNGKIFLINNAIDEKYFAKNKNLDSALIESGRFKIKIIRFDKVTRPYRFFIQSKSKSGLTDLVFIEPKNQRVFIDTIGEKIAPGILGSRIQNEMKYTYRSWFKGFIDEVEEHERYEDRLFEQYSGELPVDISFELERKQQYLLAKSDSLLFFYTLKHPNSTVALWKLIEKFSGWGYRNEYTGIYKLLTKNITNSPAGKMLLGDLNAAKVLAIGNFFPTVVVQDLVAKNITLDRISFKENRFTLVDFWFSHCRPCLVQFPALKAVLTDFGNEGFNIIGISVDIKDDVAKWKAVINDKGLDWDQYLDEDGKVSATWRINAFPTNYLLDKNGKIIAKNISPGALRKFLNRNLGAQRIYDKFDGNEPL